MLANGGANYAASVILRPVEACSHRLEDTNEGEHIPAINAVLTLHGHIILQVMP